MSERVLVIGAHCDDESFGCLGTLLKHKETGDTINLLAFTSARDAWKGYNQAANYLGANHLLMNWPDQQLDSFSLIHVIQPIENALSVFEPTIVYCPFIGDLNRDHRIVAEATIVACRPYKDNAPKEVYMYRIPGTTELGLTPFAPTEVVPINALKKKELLSQWYPRELINGREIVEEYEEFQRWPKR